MLLESAPVGAPHGRRSLILAAPLVRLTAREDLVELRALQPRAEGLLDDLAQRLPRSRRRNEACLELHLPRKTATAGRTDRDRLLDPSVFDVVRALVLSVEDAGPAQDGPGRLPIAVYGAFSYELVDHFEDLPPRAGATRVADPEPDLHLVLGLDGIEIDHEEDRATITCRSFLDGNTEREERLARERLAHLEELLRAPETTPRRKTGLAETRTSTPSNLQGVPSSPSSATFKQRVQRVLRHIDAGDVFQTVLSRSFRVDGDAEPLEVYRDLCAQNPSPYQFFLDLPDGGALFGASPECCVRVQGSEVTLRPIAGTVPRGFGKDGVAIDPDLDARRAASLLLDPKEQAEHAMLVDLARNDLARIALAGTRRVDDPFHVESYSHVHHLVSDVTATLDPRFDALDAYRACANMGTLTGAPKLRAMELIRELEDEERGFYGGAVGFLTREGEFDTCIVIRSLRYRNGTYVARAGAGIVADSVATREASETLHKAAAPLSAALSAIAAATGRCEDEAEAAKPRRPRTVRPTQTACREGSPS